MIAVGVACHGRARSPFAFFAGRAGAGVAAAFAGTSVLSETAAESAGVPCACASPALATNAHAKRSAQITGGNVWESNPPRPRSATDRRI